MNAKRKSFLLHRVEDHVVDKVEDDIYTGLITSEEGAWLYRTVGHRGLRGLFPRRIAKEKTSMSKLVVLAKDQDKMPPVEIFKSAVEKHSKAIGLAAVKDGKIITHQQIADIDGDAVHENVSNFQDAPVIMAFSSDAAMEQPYHMLGSADDPECVAFIQGDTACIESLRKKIRRERKNSGDLVTFITNAMVEEDNEDYIGEEIKRDVATDTAAILIFNTGAIAIYQTATIEDNHDWGAIYAGPKPVDGGKPVEPSKAEDKKPVSFSNMGAKSSVPVIPPADSFKGKPSLKVATIRKEHISKLPQELQSRVAPDGTLTPLNANEAYVKAPENVPDGKGGFRPAQKNDVMKWYDEHLHGGWVPSNWKGEDGKPDNPAIYTSFLKKSALEGKINLSALKDSASPAAVVAKDTANKHIPPSPNLDKDTINTFNTSDWPKLMGDNHKIIGNPQTIRDQCKTVKSFHEEIGRERITDCFMPWTALLYVSTHNPNAIAKLALSLQNHSTNQADRIAELEANVLKLEGELEEATKPKKSVASFGNMGKK